MNTILVAYILDLIWGDPDWLPHPVRGIGKLIEVGEGFIRQRIVCLHLGGAVLTAAITIGVYVTTHMVLEILGEINPWLEWVAAILLIYSCLSLRSLAQAANKVYHKLQNADLSAARKQLSHMVGRDTDRLDGQDIIRATVESVAENTVDGFISPLFYAIIGGAPLALAYKAVNTLDSMIGYKNSRYQEFGWAAARLDDAANYIPARLMYILLPVASGIKKLGWVWQMMLRDANKHPSPNSGISEAGYAACLDIQLGGISHYQGEASDKPLLGDYKAIPQPKHIKQAIALTYRLSIWAMALIILMSYVF